MENSTARSGELHYFVKFCRTGVSSRRKRCCLYVVLGIQLFMFTENEIWFARYRLPLDVSKTRSATVLFCQKEKGKVTARA